MKRRFKIDYGIKFFSNLLDPPSYPLEYSSIDTNLDSPSRPSSSIKTPFLSCTYSESNILNHSGLNLSYRKVVKTKVLSKVKMYVTINEYLKQSDISRESQCTSSMNIIIFMSLVSASQTCFHLYSIYVVTRL